jgi:hypothetical protein
MDSSPMLCTGICKLKPSYEMLQVTEESRKLLYVDVEYLSRYGCWKIGLRKIAGVSIFGGNHATFLQSV